MAGLSSGQNGRKDFVDYLFTLDESAIILKIHLKLEQKIDAVLKEILSNPSIVLDWSFLNKVDLLNAIGFLNENVSQKLRLFNSLRNKFSHRYGYKLSSDDIVFLESVGSNKEIIIPESLRRIPNIKNITLMATTGAHFEGWLSGRIDIVKGRLKRNTRAH